MASDPDETVPGILPRLAVAAALGVITACWVFHGALKDAGAMVAEHGYERLGFLHNAWLERAAAADAGLRQAGERGLLVGLAALAALLIAWAVPALRSPARLAQAFRGALVPALAIAGWAVVVGLGLWFLAEERALRGGGWLAPSDLKLAALALGVGIAWIGLVTLVARIGPEPPGRWRAAHVRALLVGGGVLIGGGYWLNRGLWTPPAETGVYGRNLALTAVAVASWAALLWRWGRGGRLLLPGALATAAAVLIAFGPYLAGSLRGSGASPSFRAKKPLNVIVLALDTVRADQTSILGDRPKQRDTTKNLRQLAERGLNFTHAISQAPWTIPAFASVLTGKYPHEHGAYVLDAKLAPRQVTLAEVLREAGYETFGVVSHMFLQEYRGFAQGYDEYDESTTRVPDIHRSASSIPVTDSAIAFLERRDGERPFFLFAHYFDPHYEYLDHARWNFAEQYQGWFREQLDFENLQKHGGLLEEQDRQWIIDLYQEELLYTDHHIGRLLNYLDESGLASTTIVVVVGDHGEAFGEHDDYYGHTITLQQEVLHVPLVIAPPRGHPVEPRSIDETVETRMVFGTLLSLLDVGWAGEPEGEAWSFAEARRRDLLRVTREGGSPGRAYSGVFLEHTSPRFGKRFKKASLIEGRYKLVHDMTRTDERLYDLGQDPGEQQPLGPGRNQKVLLPMRKALQEWVVRMERTAAGVSTVDLDAGHLDELRSLGYAGGEDDPVEENNEEDSR